jgi:ribonuclease HI
MIVIFADGSSLGNPGPGGFGAIVKLHNRIIELGASFKHTTNNRMELTATIKALEFVAVHSDEKSKVTLYTDSAYVINGITKWVFGWQRNDWKTSTKEPVLNQELWQELSALTKQITVTWIRVKGHAGIPGNERVDEIATSFSSNQHTMLYDGPIAEYGVDLETVVSQETSTDKKKKSSPKGKGFSYLSLVNGKLIRHETWSECEARVKGTSGAKFKKAMSLADEREIKKGWGF